MAAAGDLMHARDQCCLVFAKDKHSMLHQEEQKN